MSELRLAPEAENIPLRRPADVWTAFASFEEQAQQGFRTRGDELSAYRGFLDTFWSYLKNPQVSTSPSDEDKDLITRLVYSHEQIATVPIDFLAQAAKKLEESFHESPPQGSNRWKDEISSLRNFTQHELQVVGPEAILEKSAAEKIIIVAREGQEDPSVVEIQRQLMPELERRKIVQKTAVSLLAKDKALARDIQARDSFVSDTQQLIDRSLDDPGNPLLDPTRLREILERHDEYFRKSDGTSSIDSLYVSAYREEYENILDTLRGLIDEAELPGFMLKKWVTTGQVSPQLLSAFDDVLLLSELQQVAVLAADQSKSVRAALSSSYLERGVSAVMLLEIIEGRYVFPDKLIEEQLDAFIHFYDVYEETVKRAPIGIRRTLVAAALAGVVASSPFLPPHRVVETPPIEETAQAREGAPAVAEEEQNAQLQEEDVRLGTFDGQEGGWQGQTNQTQLLGGLTVDQNSPNIKPASEQQGDQKIPNQNTEPQQKNEAKGIPSNDSDYKEPQNDGIENLEKEANKIVWSLEGQSEKDMWGFYRTQTASFFDSARKSWRINKEISGDAPLAVVVQQPDVKMLQAQFVITGPTAALPIKTGFLPVKGMLRLEGITGPYSIGQRKDGAYFLRFSNADIGKTISVSVGMKKAPEGGIVAPNTYEEQREMLNRIINVFRLPNDVGNMVTSLNKREDISNLAKAKILEKYIHDNFVYSLNPAWSDYYHKGGNATEFARRVFEVRKVDCDVANTALVMLLREVGIMSRMAYGYAHEGTFLSSKATEIVALEGHGWVEVWLDGKWHSLDATPNPGEDDKYTEEALKKVLGWRRSEGLGENISITDIEKELRRLKEQEDISAQISEVRAKVRSLSRMLSGSDELIERLLLLELLNLGLMGANLAAERKNAVLVERLNRKLNERAKAYSGRHKVTLELMRGEEERLQGIEAERPPMPFRMATPFAEPLYAISNINKGTRLERFPYKEGSPFIREAVEPNSVEFLARVLGYDELEIKRKLYEDQFKTTYREVNQAMHQAIQNTLEKKGYDRGKWRYHGIFLTALKGLKRPKDISEWRTIRQQVLETITNKSQKAKVEDDASRRKEERKYKEQFPEMKPLSREDAEMILDEIFRYKVILWKMVDARNDALASTTNKKR